MYRTVSEENIFTLKNNTPSFEKFNLFIHVIKLTQLWQWLPKIIELMHTKF